jgi:hypothetical protein
MKGLLWFLFGFIPSFFSPSVTLHLLFRINRAKTIQSRS